MVSVPKSIAQFGPPLDRRALLNVLPVLAGLAAMYGPTVWELSQTIWNTDEGFHGAIVSAVAVWLFARQAKALAAVQPQPARAPGYALLVFGLLAYVAGRALGILFLEVGSAIPVLVGTLLVMAGPQALRVVWFPLVYLVFVIPLPGTLVDALTQPLKQWVSVIAEHLLYTAGYPVARTGVMLTVGQYQLLIADACSGLRSMFSLSALGTLFVYLMQRKSVAHNVVMLASILPVAFAANIVRVMILVLITYHLGDEAGQGFLHGTAGIVLLMVALMILFVIDAGLARVIRPRRRASA